MVLKLPLDSLHESLGGKFFEFAGWKMPMKYTSSLKEAISVRNSAGIFDVSHMGRFLIKGPDVLEFLQRATSNDMKVKDGRTRYTLTLNEKGGIKDDNVAFKIKDDYVLFVVNAANREKIYKWFHKLLDEWNLDLEIEDITLSTTMLAIQGPHAKRFVHRVLGKEFEMKKFRVVRTLYDERELYISTTGYTGEDGYELVISDFEWAESIYKELVNLGVTPCGLVARDILRLEAGLVLYGNDMDEETNPFEAKLDFAVKMSKQYFVGKEALQNIRESEISRIRVGITSGTRRSPRRGDKLFSGDKEVGIVTSGTFSPTTGAGIGMAYVSSEYSSLGTKLVLKGIKEFPVTVTKMPFYDESKYGWRRST